jgi:hypothetical protein
MYGVFPYEYGSPIGVRDKQVLQELLGFKSD